MAEWENEFKHPITYLLTEAGFFLTLESGGKIVLNQTGKSNALWDNEDKS